MRPNPTSHSQVLQGYITHVNYTDNENAGEPISEMQNAVVISNYGSLKLWFDDVSNDMFIQNHLHIRFIFHCDKLLKPNAGDVYICELVNPSDGAMRTAQRRYAMAGREIKLLYEPTGKETRQQRPLQRTVPPNSAITRI